MTRPLLLFAATTLSVFGQNTIVPTATIRSFGPQTGCSAPAGSSDASLCQIPNEIPLGYLNPATGTSYIDPNFGGEVKTILTAAIHNYSLPSPLSAHQRYLLLRVQPNYPAVIADPMTGAILYPNVPYSSQGTFWDAEDDDSYYFLQAAKIVKHSVSGGFDKVLIDYSQLRQYAFDTLETGGSTETSKDNWASFWNTAKHQVCTVDLNSLKTYCADYRAASVVGRTGPWKFLDYITMAKGIDSGTGKRYVLLMGTPAMAVWSVNLAAGVLDAEFRGPENLYGVAKGNRDGVCDAGESCLNAPHGDTVEDVDGKQYFVTVKDYSYTPCERDLVRMPIAAGLVMSKPREFGGAMTTVAHLAQCGGQAWPDDHIGCAKSAPYCAISLYRDQLRTESDRMTPFPLEPYRNELWFMKGDGTSVIRMATTRSVGFPSDSYWYQPRAAISNDGSAIIFDSNFGHPEAERVNLVRTGLPASQPQSVAQLQSLTLAAIRVGGAAVLANNTVSLQGSAGSSGLVVNLNSSDPGAAVVPNQVTILPGHNTERFTIKTSAVRATTPVTITASAGGVTKTIVLEVVPSGCAGRKPLSLRTYGESSQDGDCTASQ